MPDEEYDANFRMIPPAELDELRAKAGLSDEYLAVAKRVQADFINFQDRVRAEKADAAAYAIEKFMKDLIPALDAFQSSLQHAADPGIAAGIQMIEKEIWRVLAKWGVKTIETAGKEFDPKFHQATAVEESAEKPDMSILAELKPGYMLHDRVLRPAWVRVSRAPAPESK